MQCLRVKDNSRNINSGYILVMVSIFLIGFILITSAPSIPMTNGQEEEQQQQSTTISNSSSSSPLSQTNNNNNNKIIQQGTITSISNPWPGHEGHQIATILPTESNSNNDSSMVKGYTGILTYTASKPVQILVLHKYSVEQSMIDTNKFGSGLVTPINNNTYDLTVIQPQYNASVPTYSYSIPFTGDGVVLHTFGDHFVATYRVSADVDEAKTMNNIENGNLNK
jgi:hypothetical protein